MTKKKIYLNGQAEIVIQDVQAYEEMAGLLHSLKQLAIAKKQHDNSEAIPADEAFAQLSKKLAV